MTDMPPPFGRAQALAPGLRRVLAPNPSPMTHWGTNTYLLGGAAGLAVIDPGPADSEHLAALLRAIGRAPVSHILVTHSHLDHSALAAALARATGAPVLAFGDAEAGRSAAMRALVEGGLRSGGEGVDLHFAPDRTVADGDVIAGPGWRLEVMHTPGHMGNHICLRWEDGVFTGDHVMGWASSLVSPPDGDLTDFMASCARLAARPAARFYPGHGAPVTDPAARLAWLIAHRQAREGQILSALHDAPEGLTLAALTARIYTDTPAALHPAAARNVLAHLVDLIGQNLATASQPLSDTSTFHARRRRA